MVKQRIDHSDFYLIVNIHHQQRLGHTFTPTRARISPVIILCSFVLYLEGAMMVMTVLDDDDL